MERLDSWLKKSALDLQLVAAVEEDSLSILLKS